MGQESDCISVVRETIKEFGGLDIIISNAVGLQDFPYSSFLLLFKWINLIKQGLYALLNLLRPLSSYRRRLAKMLCYECGSSDHLDERGIAHLSGERRGWSLYHDQ